MSRQATLGTSSAGHSVQIRARTTGWLGRDRGTGERHRRHVRRSPGRDREHARTTAVLGSSIARQALAGQRISSCRHALDSTEIERGSERCQCSTHITASSALARPRLRAGYDDGARQVDRSAKQKSARQTFRHHGIVARRLSRPRSSACKDNGIARELDQAMLNRPTYWHHGSTTIECRSQPRQRSASRCIGTTTASLDRVVRKAGRHHCLTAR